MNYIIHRKYAESIDCIVNMELTLFGDQVEYVKIIFLSI